MQCPSVDYDYDHEHRRFATEHESALRIYDRLEACPTSISQPNVANQTCRFPYCVHH